MAMSSSTPSSGTNRSFRRLRLSSSSRAEAPSQVDTVYVREGGKWIPVKDWLLKAGDDSTLQLRGASSIKYFLRKRDPNKFRLMDLPTELSLMIFERVVAPKGEVYSLSKALKAQWRPDVTTAERQNAHLSLGIGYDGIPHIRDGALSYMFGEDSDDPLEHQKRISPPSLVLLYVSKQVQAEALTVGWEGVKRCFLQPSLFTIVADSNIGVATLGRIQFSFPMKAWFKFFGLAVDPSLSHDTAASQGHYLAALDEKCRLELRFRDLDDGFRGDPLYEGYTSCQSVLVDWIMTFAYDHIKHIKNVDLVGYIKTPQK
jgi:hypothetical protein